MAGGIKGITVKIGGDTSELGKALNGASKNVTALQKELKGVNSLLKYDPTNITLLNQKHDILKNAIEESTKKQKALNEVLEKVNNGEIKMTADELRNLEREIISNDNKLKNLNKELKEVEKSSEIGLTPTIKKLQEIGNKAEETGKKLQKIGDNVSNAGKKVSGLSVAAGGILTGSIVASSNFADSIAKVGTVADTSKVSLDKLGDDILELSNKTGMSADEIADATYNAISAGQDTADAVKFVENATTLAKAGFTDTASSIDVLTTIMNAYGLEASEVGKVSDTLINIQNKGKTTVAELSSTMGKIIPTANAMGVGLDQLGAGYAIMTSNGIATAETTTYMNSMLNELGKSSTKVGSILKDKTGKSFQELMQDGYTVGDVLEILKNHADESGTSFNELWSSSEAGKAGLVLIKDGADDFNKSVQDMNDATGSTASAFDKLQTPSQKAKISINQLKNAGVELGDTILTALAPVIDSLCKAISSLTKWFSNLNPHIKTVIAVVLGLITALAPVLLVVGKLISAFGTVMTIIPKLVSAFKMVQSAMVMLNAVISANPIGALIVAITALVAAFLYAYKNCEWFRDMVNKVFKTMVDVVKGSIDFIVNLFTGIINFVKNNWQGLLLLIVNPFAGAFKLVYDNCEGFRTFINTFIENVKTTFRNGINAIVSFFTVTLPNGINNAIGFIKSIPSKIFNAINGAISVVSNWGNNLINTIKTKISSMVSSAVSIAKKLPNEFLNIGKNIVNGLLNGITQGTTKLYNGIKNTLSGLVNKAKSALGIHSPSKVFADVIGKQIPEGVRVGIEDNIDSAVNAVDDMNNALTGFNGATINRKLNTTFVQDTANALTGESQQIALLKDIKTKLGSLQVVLDSGELVGGLIDKIDNNLGVKNNQIMRGW